jgi:hypothetical protein
MRIPHLPTSVSVQGCSSGWHFLHLRARGKTKVYGALTLHPAPRDFGHDQACAGFHSALGAVSIDGQRITVTGDRRLVVPEILSASQGLKRPRLCPCLHCSLPLMLEKRPALPRSK